MGIPYTDMLEAQVFQLASCNVHCWYCFVPDELKHGKIVNAKWFTAEQMIELYKKSDTGIRVIDLSGGNPELAPEWILDTMKALERNELQNKVYLWTDDTLTTDYAFECLSKEETSYMAWNKLYRREIFDTLRFEVGKLHEDVFFTYQAFGKSKCIIKIDDCLYYYRQRSGSIMGSSFSIRNLDSMEARKRQYYYMKENYPRLTDKAQSQAMGNCLYFGQKAVLCLDPEVREEALQIILDVYEKIYNSQPIHESKKQKFWYDLAKWNFRFCCKIRNWLKIGL